MELQYSQIDNSASAIEKSRIFRVRAPELLNKSSDETLAALYSESKHYHMDKPFTEIAILHSFIQNLGGALNEPDDYMLGVRVFIAGIEKEIISRFLVKHSSQDIKPEVIPYDKSND